MPPVTSHIKTRSITSRLAAGLLNTRSPAFVTRPKILLKEQPTTSLFVYGGVVS